MSRPQKRLTLEQLRAIQQRNLKNTDTMMLLREIKRLHGILHNCWQVLDNVPSGTVNSPLDLFKGLVDNEPCVQAQRAAYERANWMGKNKARYDKTAI